MAVNTNDDKSIPTETEAYYEELASQEEIYLEEIEEKARAHAILISENPAPSRSNPLSIDRESLEVNRSVTDVRSTPPAEGADEQLDHAAEELITGDSDDPPLSEETVVEMLRRTHMPKGSGP